MIIENDTVIPFSKMRRMIADRLAYSKSHIPHFTLEVDVDMDASLKLRVSYNSGHGLRVSVNDLIVKAAAGSLRTFEKLNSHVSEDKLVVKKDINIGIAVSVDGGIIVPVIPKADSKTIDEISGISRKKIADARRCVVDPRIAGTFTISNLGTHGVKSFTPIINPPECGILAVGCIEKRVIHNEKRNAMEAHSMMSVTLACDHRGTDGVYAAEFLSCVKRMLEEPETLFKEGGR